MPAAIDIEPPAVAAAQLIRSAEQALAAAGVRSARLDAEVLLAAACGMERSAVYTRAREPLPQHCRVAFDAMLARRLAREPLQYIVGHQEFWSLDFLVTPDVLIPRPETELLVEWAVKTLLPKSGARPLSLCDLGTGSGCIAVALARELPHATISALDVSPAALAVAGTNAHAHGVADRIRFVESRLFAAVTGVRFDAIICNPPYVASVEGRREQPELAWEPRLALAGGVAGLEVIAQVLAEAPRHLRAGGWLLMEMGAEQGALVADMARSAQLNDVSVRSDYAGLPRMLIARG
jgi:release factor glutamine methyltransferase